MGIIFNAIQVEENGVQVFIDGKPLMRRPTCLTIPMDSDTQHISVTFKEFLLFDDESERDVKHKTYKVFDYPATTHENIIRNYHEETITGRFHMEHQVIDGVPQFDETGNPIMVQVNDSDLIVQVEDEPTIEVITDKPESTRFTGWVNTLGNPYIIPAIMGTLKVLPKDCETETVL